MQGRAVAICLGQLEQHPVAQQDLQEDTEREQHRGRPLPEGGSSLRGGQQAGCALDELRRAPGGQNGSRDPVLREVWEDYAADQQPRAVACESQRRLPALGPCSSDYY